MAIVDANYCYSSYKFLINSIAISASNSNIVALDSCNLACQLQSI